MPELFEFFFLWKSKVYLHTSTIKVRVYVRLTLFLKNPNGIHVHDGPGMDSDQVNHNRSVIHLSSFQAFVVVFTCTWTTKYHMHLQEFGLSYKGRDIKATKVNINNSETLELPPCTVLRHTNWTGCLISWTCIKKTSNVGQNSNFNQTDLITVIYPGLVFSWAQFSLQSISMSCS